MKRIGVIGLALCAGLLTGADSAQKRDTVLNMKRELAKTTPWLDLSDKRSGAGAAGATGRQRFVPGSGKAGVGVLEEQLG